LWLSRQERGHLGSLVRDLIGRCKYWSGKQAGVIATPRVPLNDQLDVLAIEQADIDLRVKLPHQPKLAVLTRNERLPHGRHLDIDVVVREVEVRCEALNRLARFGGNEGKGHRLVQPPDSERAEQVGDDCLGRMGKAHP